jgi:Fic family protein
MALDLLNFTADLRHMPVEFWLQLGEAKAKCEEISAAPLLPHVRAEMHRIYLVKGVQATTAIEGNTLTESEVAARIGGSLTLPPSREYLGREVDNVVAAINGLVQGSRERFLAAGDLCKYNTMVLRNLDVSEGVVPGRFREINVGVGLYQCPNFRTVPRLVNAFINWFNEFPETYFERMEMQTAIIKAVLTHLYFVLIHPFGDGNGRTGRLLEWRVLDHAGVPTAATHLLSNHYNQTRTEYYRHLDHASQTGSVAGFLSYAIYGYVDQLGEQLKFIKRQQYELVYIRYVSEAFAADKSETAHRRRRLALAILEAQDPVDRARLRTLSPRLAEAYGAKTQKTVTRDVNALLLAGLIVELPDGKVISTVSADVFRHARKPLVR